MIKISRTLTSIAAVTILGLGALAVPQAAQAHPRHHHHHGGIFAFTYPYSYDTGPYFGPDCFWVRKRVWDGFAWHWRRVRVCE